LSFSFISVMYKFAANITTIVAYPYVGFFSFHINILLASSKLASQTDVHIFCLWVRGTSCFGVYGLG